MAQQFEKEICANLIPENEPERTAYYLDDIVPGAIPVLAYFADSGGCGWYRVKLPAAYVNRDYGQRVNMIVSNFISKEEVLQSNTIPWKAFLLERQHTAESIRVAEILKLKYNAPIIYEADDDFFTIHPSAPTKAAYTPEILANIKKLLKITDHMTVSTEPLVKVFNKFCSSVTVIPNAIDVEFMKTIAKKKEDYERDEIVIGWTGGQTHFIDLSIIASTLKDVVLSHKNVKLLIGGWDNCPLFADMPEDKMIRIPWAHKMRQHYTNLRNIDIGVAPLADVPFNHSKSNIKYLELSAVGIPTIASDITPYGQTIKHEKNGLLIKASGAVSKQWRDALEYLIASVKVRKAMGLAAKDMVYAKYDQKIVSKQWVEFFERVTKK
jgi:glycosyltransferase involved in cell wall biosynthesis